MVGISAALTAASVAGQLFSAHKGGEANEANYRLLDQEKADNEAFYNKNVNRDYMETNAAKGLVTRLNKSLKNRNKTVDSNAATTGGTAESVIAEKSKNQENHNNVMSQVAEKATSHQLGAESIHARRKTAIVGAEMGLNQQKSDSAANLASNAAGVASAAANLTASGKKLGPSGEILAGDGENKDPYNQKIV